MLISITGTPGVGKTTISNDMEGKGWVRVDLNKFIIQRGLEEGVEEVTGEILVDIGRLKEGLKDLTTETDKNMAVDGHLSYLAPSDICIVLRLDPAQLKNRLEDRGYRKEKVRENLEAEAVSVILVEAVEIEDERLSEKDWTELIPGAGIVFEIDVTDISRDEMLEKVMNIIDCYQGKRLIELAEYRPGKVDWLEVMAEWS